MQPLNMAKTQYSAGTTKSPASLPGSGPVLGALMSGRCRDRTALARSGSLTTGPTGSEIHAAHGYLFHQFYSPLANTRKDEYGGSFENRIRLLLEVTWEVKKEWGDEKPLFVRISATDWTEGGWTIEDSVKLANKLKTLGVDLIDTSTGGNVPRATIPTSPGYQAGFAETIKKKTGILTGAVGQITNAEQSEEILQKGMADLILYARESLRNPNLPLYMAYSMGENVEWPIQYNRAKVKL